MHTALDTNPTENKVLDVSLPLEKIVADFATFKGDVKSKVREKLKVSSIFGTSYQFADWVWGILDEYGFRSIERIITFFEQEEMQEKLAKVILNDNDLQARLGYGNDTGSMDYMAVAKVGILVFADHIHDTFIGTSGWKSQLWYSLMGSATLVDLVNQIWNVASTAVSTIKDAANKALNAVKSGLSFISNAVLTLMLSTLMSGINLLAKGIFISLDTLLSAFSYSEVGNNHILSILGDDLTFGLSSSGHNIDLTIGGIMFRLSDVFQNANFETLSVADAVIKLDVIEWIMTGIVGLSSGLAIAKQAGAAMMTLYAGLAAGLLSQVFTFGLMFNDLTPEEQSELKVYLLFYHAVSLFMSLMMTIGKALNDSVLDAVIEGATLLINMIMDTYTGSQIASSFSVNPDLFGRIFDMTQIHSSARGILLSIAAIGAQKGAKKDLEGQQKELQSYQNNKRANTDPDGFVSEGEKAYKATHKKKEFNIFMNGYNELVALSQGGYMKVMHLMMAIPIYHFMSMIYLMGALD